jgi:GTP-binding protein YchF
MSAQSRDAKKPSVIAAQYTRRRRDMKLGLIGLPNSGKTTIFNALTNSEEETKAFTADKTEPNRAVVNVIDERITHLSEMYRPKKTVYAAIEIMDFAGNSQIAANESILSDHSIALIRSTDALAFVVRHFQDDLMKAPNPLGDIQRMEEELLFSDLVICEGRLERIEWNYKRGKKTGALQTEEKTLRRILAQIHEDKPIREMQLNQEEQRIIHGFHLLSRKPIMIVLNSDEESFGTNRALLDQIGETYNAVEFAGKFEMELSRLDDEQEIGLFMHEMGIEDSARDRLTRLAYETLQYISFFTVGADEVRAWNLSRGKTALGAAASIHTDLARGFIRAECFSYADAIECGAEKTIRERGRFRLEGKNYIVEDGDILSIRYNV